MLNPKFYKTAVALSICLLQGCSTKQIVKNERPESSNSLTIPKAETKDDFSGFANSEWFGEYKGANPSATIQLKMDAVCFLGQENGTLKMGSYAINNNNILIAQGEKGWKGTLKNGKLIVKNFMGEQTYVLTKQKGPFDPTA